VPLMRWVGRAIGLDVHRDFCVVAICEDGKVRSADRVPSTPEGLGLLAQSLLATDRVALEVTGGCWEVARILEPFVDRVVVVSPDDTGIASARAMTDKLDSRTLAGLLWKGELEAVWMPDERCRMLRRRLARREQLMRARTRSKNEIRRCWRWLQGKAPCSDLFGVKGRQWLAGLELAVEERESVDAGLRQIAFMDSEIAAVDRLIAQQALRWPEIRRLMTVSGVNLICAGSVHGRGRRALPVLDQPQDGGVPRSGSKGPPIRRGTRTVGSDLQARVGVRAVGAGRGGVERGQATRTAARVLRTDPRAAGSRQSDRRDRPQTHRPVLVHAHPLRGLRAPATRADQQETAPARADRRRPGPHQGSRWDLEHQPDDPARRTCSRHAGRGVLQADGHRPKGRTTITKSGRERDTGARINQALKEGIAARQTQSS
jgi:transposase